MGTAFPFPLFFLLLQGLMSDFTVGRVPHSTKVQSKAVDRASGHVDMQGAEFVNPFATCF